MEALVSKALVRELEVHLCVCVFTSKGDGYLGGGGGPEGWLCVGLISTGTLTLAWNVDLQKTTTVLRSFQHIWVRALATGQQRTRERCEQVW